MRNHDLYDEHMELIKKQEMLAKIGAEAS